MQYFILHQVFKEEYWCRIGFWNSGH